MIYLNLYCTNEKCSKFVEEIRIENPPYHGTPKKTGWIFKQQYCKECNKPIETSDELKFKPLNYIRTK